VFFRKPFFFFSLPLHRPSLSGLWSPFPCLTFGGAVVRDKTLVCSYPDWPGTEPRHLPLFHGTPSLERRRRFASGRLHADGVGTGLGFYAFQSL